MVEEHIYERLLKDSSGEMHISLGEIHKYLGTTLDCAVPNEVSQQDHDVSAYDKEIVKLFAKHGYTQSTATTPAAEHLFKQGQ